MADERKPIQLCEWGRSPRRDLVPEERRALADAAAAWQAANHLPAPPLWFEGPEGRTLCARQYVGVVEAAGRTVEIYPKLDAELIDRDTVDETARAGSVLRSLLWMLEVSEYWQLVEADTATLKEMPSRFLDLFAYLLGKNLREELTQGVARRYEPYADDLRRVRGRIRIAAQVTRNWDRRDRIACAWDEFTPDTPVNRLLRCACRALPARVRHPEAVHLLQDCAYLLDEVAEVAPATALRESASLRHWDRGSERFRRSFDLARRLLQGFAHALEAASSDTFVFLLDMNRVFEAYVRAVLEARFQTGVACQKRMGTLFQLPTGGIEQKADFFWEAEGRMWIGDAKYKHLARGQRNALSFRDVDAGLDETESVAGGARAGQVLSADDVRQLTVYAELDRRRMPGAPPPCLLLLYPFVGAGRFAADRAEAWNGSAFWLVPLGITPGKDLSAAMPSLPEP